LALAEGVHPAPDRRHPLTDVEVEALDKRCGKRNKFVCYYGFCDRLPHQNSEEGACIMEYELRVIVEKVAVSSQEVVKRETIKTYEITTPASIMDLGLRHAEQISLLEKVQNVL
jgi:hypothetical protein